MSDALIQTEFAGYRIDSRVGRGGMGVVYRATDLSLDRAVALKVLTEDLAQDPGFRRRFAEESKLAASLDHPNVIPIHAAGEHDGVLYIAMRLVAGDDLRTVLRANGRLAPERTVRLIVQVASALDAAHARGLVHRDVKPANLLLTADDHVYLTDFGLSKRVSGDTEATRTGMVLGSLDYIAPEQIRGDRVGAYTDVYSLGCLIVHLLTGRVPFPVDTEEGKLWAHFSEPPPRPSARTEGLDPAFDAIVARAMSKRPQDRFPTAGEVGTAMQAALAAAAERHRAPPGRAPPAAQPAVPLSIAPVPAATGPPGPPSAPPRRELVVAALTEPFNVVVLGALLVAGALLDTVALMVPLALVVYALSVWRSLRDPDTVRRLQGGRSRKSLRDG
ncbi:MAG TPA: serine/threonine-protein kinase [Solirubrobacteraceae bacterium]|nr:serine/threonine-protein kinase [Solirubrobacteraceae bacterium]